MPDDEPTTEELKLRQLRREAEERAYAADADTDAETGSHERRADKARYLREKLEQREQAERRAGLPDE